VKAESALKSLLKTYLREGVCLDLSKVLASSLRQKILKVLSEKREMQVMKLVSSVGSTYNELNRNLLILEKEGIIINEYPVKVRHGKVRIIRLNKENSKTQVLLKVMKTLDQETHASVSPI
jgi:predicted transcriptional regulator